jgi:uncharacterized SAM-binding protein YcdF (DUF218 family)
MEAVALYFLNPLTVALFAWLAAGVLRIARAPRSALACAVAAFIVLWVGSTPWLADTMSAQLEGRYPALTPQATPNADAILVLGGAVSGVKLPERPTLMLGPASTRVWHAAALYKAGKAKWIVVAAGNRPAQALEQTEADAIAEMLVQLGVPRTAIVEERESRTTRDNARNALPILERLGARRVLLVTSALHMPRAMKTFVSIWTSRGPQLIPAVTDVRGPPAGLQPLELWFPSLDALLVVTRALKEFAGMAVLAIIQ